MSVKEITQDNFENLLEQHSFLALDFWAPWCAPCKMFSPIFHEVAAQHPDVLFGQINIDEQPALASDFGIASIPTLMIMRDKVVVFAESGVLPKSALDDLIQQAKALDMQAVRAAVESEGPFG